MTDKELDELSDMFNDLVRGGMSREEAARQVDLALAEQTARKRRARQGLHGPVPLADVNAVLVEMGWLPIGD